VDVERRAAVVLAELEVFVGARATDKLDGVLGDPVQRHGSGVVGVDPGRPKQRARDLLDFESALPDEQQPVVLGRSGLEVGEQDLDEAEYPEQRVVDLVREPPDELSERAEPPCFEEGFAFGGGWFRAEERRSGCGWLHWLRYRKKTASAVASRR
jgi:hypothetical protein